MFDIDSHYDSPMMEKHEKHLLEDAIEAVKYEDRNWDHSFNKLTEDEKLEIEVFKNIKKDKYF